MRGFREVGEIRYKGGRPKGGLNDQVEKIGGHLQVLICQKESEEKGKSKLPDGGKKRTPSLLNLAPTSLPSGGSALVDDYG